MGFVKIPYMTIYSRIIKNFYAHCLIMLKTPTHNNAYKQNTALHLKKKYNTLNSR